MVVHFAFYPDDQHEALSSTRIFGLVILPRILKLLGVRESHSCKWQPMRDHPLVQKIPDFAGCEAESSHRPQPDANTANNLHPVLVHSSIPLPSSVVCDLAYQVQVLFESQHRTPSILRPQLPPSTALSSGTESYQLLHRSSPCHRFSYALWISETVRHYFLV